MNGLDMLHALYAPLDGPTDQDDGEDQIIDDAPDEAAGSDTAPDDEDSDTL